MVCIDDVPEVLERDTVIFSVECHTRMGEEVLLVGSTPELGCWDLAGAVRMTTNSEDFPTWTSSPIPRLAIGRTEANPVGYKYVLSRGAEGATWEQGPDRSIGLDELLGLSEEGVHDDLFRRDPSVAKSPHSRRAKKIFSHPSKSRSKSRAKSRSRARAAEDSTALAEVQVLRQQLEQQRAKAAEDSAALAEVKVLKQQLEQQRSWGKSSGGLGGTGRLQVLRQQLEQQRAKAAEDSAALAELQVLRQQLEQQRAKAAEDSAALAEVQVLRLQLEQQRAKAAEDSAALAELQVLRQQLEQQRAKAAEDSAARPGFYRWFRKRLSSRPGVATLGTQHAPKTNCKRRRIGRPKTNCPAKWNCEDEAPKTNWAKMNCEDELPKTNSAPVARRRRIAEDDFPKPAQAQEHDHHQQARSPKDEFGARRRIARRRRIAKTNCRRRIRCPETNNSAKTTCEDELLPKTNWAPDGELPGEDELRRRSAEDKLGA
ncbi:unnamed protein product [Polarella glacialis]|uniref:CBM20 domain-containing protein n=1 Tax=Polarella glacialis TaxID=89957 RepID=A0A813KRD8_POLGL|nr:unnamed protein product [Polarella glacialis]